MVTEILSQNIEQYSIYFCTETYALRTCACWGASEGTSGASPNNTETQAAMDLEMDVKL